ncbi:MAG: rSAM/selenodomain-associated transferase 2 [Flavobacteriales bacterium]
MKSKLSIIIPILNERPQIERSIEYLLSLSHVAHELIFVDGGSKDGSREFLTAQNLRTIESPRGRAAQMNAGALCANGDILLFLHVDSQTPENMVQRIGELNDFVWGFFRIRLTSDKRIFRFIERGINFRSRVFSVATGDQGLFVKRSKFHQINGFAPIPLMEDIEITRRLKKLAKPYIVADSIQSSARRWQKHGTLYTVFFMWYVQALYVLGVSPNYLVRLYYKKAKSNV